MRVSAIWRLMRRDVPRVATWKRVGSMRRILSQFRANQADDRPQRPFVPAALQGEADQRPPILS
jgi:hypothetical protein